MKITRLKLKRLIEGEPRDSVVDTHQLALFEKRREIVLTELQRLLKLAKPMESLGYKSSIRAIYRAIETIENDV